MRDAFEDYVGDELFISLDDGKAFSATYIGMSVVAGLAFVEFSSERDTRWIRLDHVLEMKKLREGSKIGPWAFVGP